MSEARQALAHQASDLQRELEHAAPLGAVDRNRVILGNSKDEAFGLRRECIAAGVHFLGLPDFAALLPHVAQLAGLQVGGGVEAGLEHAELAHHRLAHAARREVGDAAVGELDARGGDVDVAGQHAEAAGADAADLGARERQREVEVMDHEIEDHVDLRAALLEAGEALGVDVQRAVDALRQRLEGFAVALHMADLQHGFLLRRQVHQVVGFGERGGERLLDQHVQPALEEGARHFVVQVRRHGNHRGVDVAQDLSEIGNRRARGIGIDHRGELHAGQTREFLGVEAPHVTGADDSEPQ